MRKKTNMTVYRYVYTIKVTIKQIKRIKKKDLYEKLKNFLLEFKIFTASLLFPMQQL